LAAFEAISRGHGFHLRKALVLHCHLIHYQFDLMAALSQNRRYGIFDVHFAPTKDVRR
jgi:hypothetical protein